LNPHYNLVGTKLVRNDPPIGTDETRPPAKTGKESVIQ